jgi:hypothetical protein
MENQPFSAQPPRPNRSALDASQSHDKDTLSHKRSLPESIMSKLSFLRTNSDDHSAERHQSIEFGTEDDPTSPKKSGRAMAVVVQQQKPRRRKGSLRKAALLGRGAQREKKETRSSPLEIESHQGYSRDYNLSSPEESPQQSQIGLGISDDTPRPSMEGYASRSNNTLINHVTTLPMGSEDIVLSPTNATSPTLTYTSTTDDDDVLSIPRHVLPAARAGNSSGSDSYFSSEAGSLARRRSANRAKSPLSVSGLATSPLPVPEDEWDYSETEWWGWVVLIVTWVVFVIGMGSCLGVWSWAWDVGETPYAPPELNDDESLPIVGYYPALIILTAVMAWVWVVVAWVGMKYFRHAKISGD